MEPTSQDGARRHRLRVTPPTWRLVVDEIEFMRAYNNLRTLIESSTDPDIGPTSVRNALLTIAALLDDLNQRVLEMQAGDEEDDE